MEAPEKIYLYPYSTDGIYEVETKPLEGTVEYIRTDAFIDKALKFLDGCIPEYVDLKHANVDTFMNVDNKRFIEDFRKYMEGE